MTRSTWVVLLVTAVVLVVAGNLPRLPLAGLAASWRAGVERQVAQWPRIARRAPAVVPAPSLAARATRTAAGSAQRRPLIAVSPARLLATVSVPAPALPRFMPRSWPVLPPYVTVPALAGVLAGLLVIAVLGLALRRDRRSRVWQLARRGTTLARIARTARIPQDAVRSLLAPGLVVRR